MSHYVTEIKSIDSELKRIANRRKELMTQKKNAQIALYDYMARQKINELGGIKKEKIQPRSTPKLTSKEKKQRTLQLFQQTGIPDPEEFFRRIKSIGKKSEEKTD